MRYLVGIIGFCAGMAMIVYRERLKRAIGDVPSFEKYFGPGGTYTGLMILGFCLSIGSVLWMTGTIQSLLKSLLGPIFGI